MDLCRACGKDSQYRRCFQSKKGLEKQLAQLYKTYTSIEVSVGFLCKKCHDKLLAIDKTFSEFRGECFKTQELFLSSSSSPLANTNNSRSKNVDIRPCSTVTITDHEQYDCDDSQSVSSNQSSNFVEHSYCHIKAPTKKKQKTVVTPCGIPAVFEHDHSYYTGAVTDQSLFKIPDVVKIYFSEPETDNLEFEEEEVKVLHRFLENKNIQMFIKQMFLTKKGMSVFTNELSKTCKETASKMGNVKKGFVSLLMKKDLSDLESFQWSAIVQEFSQQLPILFMLIVKIMLPNDDHKKMVELLPRVGLVYSIIMQSRHPSLSLIQRTVSLLLMDNICDQKVYDRLQVVGVSLSYQKSLHLLELMNGSFNVAAINALSEKKTIRIIGDNVNFCTGIKEQNHSHEGRTSIMHHAFANALLINKFDFLTNLSSSSPQRVWHEMTPSDFLVSNEEQKEVKLAYVHLICKVIGRFIPSLNFMSTVIPQITKGEHSSFLTEKTIVLPLETLPLNEQKYEDVVKILEYYETTIKELSKTANVNLQDDDHFHVGGDQLTRERFSGAKKLRAGADNIRDKFGHLHPITFEFFHLLMNFLKVFNHFLYDKKSSQEVGTMMAELNRIRRTNFDPDVNNAYDADRDFILSFTDAHIIELTLEFFGMEAVTSNPTKHVPPEFLNDTEKKQWVYTTIGKLLDEHLFITDNPSTEEHVQDVIEEASIITCTLADGSSVEIKVNKNEQKKKNTNKTDGVLNYAKLVLNLGLVFKELIEVCKVPNRKRMIRILKQCLVIFKAKSNLSKYALEILRFLVQQQVVLSEKTATETFYSMFVNTRGKIDTHIPADLQMEYLVKLTKKHIKHMFSNKTDENISKKTRVLSTISSVCENYDSISDVKVRCKKHKHQSYHDDELLLIEDLRKIRPFKRCNGRVHPTFTNTKGSLSELLDAGHFHQWILRRISLDSTDLGL